jgi:hypothetical protein
MPILYVPEDGTYVPPPETRPPYEPLPVRQAIPMDITWEGADGSVWNLTSPASAVRLGPGIRGLEAVNPERWVSDSPGLAGNRYRGHRVPAREVFLPVYVYGQGSTDWLTVRNLWDHSLSEDSEGVLSVVCGDRTRTLPCRWVKSEQGWTRDPLAAGKSAIGEYFEAAGSYWQSEPITRSWYDANEQDFFVQPGEGGGVFFITRSNKLSTAKIDNPGDVPAWPVWTLAGPFATAQVGIGANIIEIPFALALGETLTIDTRPENQSAIDGTGASRELDLGTAIFAPIPADTNVTLAISATGMGEGFSIRASLTPLYKRAWSL